MSGSVSPEFPEDFIPESFLRDLRLAARRGEHAEVDQLLADCEQTVGRGPFLAEAISWAARAYQKKAFQMEAVERARQAYALGTQLLAAGHSLAPNHGTASHLSIALGASIEVIAQITVEQGNPQEAIRQLEEAYTRHREAPFAIRIRKNLLQLTLPGQPALPLDLTPLKGTKAAKEPLFGDVPTLLFFWAHWCSDSRAQSRTLVEYLNKHPEAKFRFIAPTRCFGYITKGSAAKFEEEVAHIQEVLESDYQNLRKQSLTNGFPVPLSTENLELYGVSTFPTLVLVDAEGIVQHYHPGAMKLEELEAKF